MPRESLLSWRDLIVGAGVLLFVFVLMVGRTDLPIGDGLDIRLALIPALLMLAWSRVKPSGSALLCGLLILTLLAFLALSATWNRTGFEPALISDKLVDLAWLAVVCVCALLASSNLQDRRLLWLGLAAAGGLIALAAAYFLLARGLGNLVAGRLVIPGTGPITLSRACAYALLALLFLKDRRPLVIGAPLLVLIILATGSRGTLVAGVVAAAIYIVLSRTGPRQIAAAIAPTAVVATAGMLIMTYTAIGRTVQKTAETRILATVVDRYTAGRDMIYDHAVTQFMAHPLTGSGLASFRFGAFRYPHNLFLEVGGEAGLLAVTLLVAALAVALVAQAPRENRAGLTFLTFAVVSALFSGELYDNRWVFVAAVFCANVAVALRPLPISDGRPA